MNKNSIDMVNGPLLKNIFIFCFPLMAMNLLNMVFNAADTIVVGKFAGDAALAAVGATGSLIFLFSSLLQGLSVGTNVVIANAIGAKDDDKIAKSVSSSIIMGIAGGILLALLGLFASRAMLEFMSTPADIIDQSTTYMKIVLGGAIFMVVYNFGAAILRSKGDTRRPLYFLFISGVINVLLNLLFVIVFHLDVVGVAVATIISQAIACGMLLYSLMHENDATRVDFRKLYLDMNVVYETMRIGIPAGLQGMAFSLSNVVIQSSINSFDSSIIVAGNSAAANVENFTYIGMMAFAQATITFTSQNVGANRKDNVKKIMDYTMALDIASSLIMGVLVWYFGDFLISLYTDDMMVIASGKIRLFYVCVFLFLNGAMDIYINSMRGMGRSSLPTASMIIGVCGVRLLWLWFVFPEFKSLEMIYICYPISWLVTTIFEAILWVDTHKKLISE